MTEGNNNNAKETSVDDVESTSENEEAIPKEETEEQLSSKSEVKSEEIKQLEEKEHYELEYFSKEEFLKNIKNLEEELTKIKDRAQKLQKENDESKSKYMLLQAEFENAQKRWNKTRQDLNTQYTASVLKNFLPLYDSFKKAIESANETEINILNGFYNQFINIFKSYGAEPISVNVNDIFDYSMHEALTSIEKEDVPENSILEIVQDGWKYGKEIIRYAKVITSRKPKPPEPEPEEIEAKEEVAEESISDEAEPEEKKEDEKAKEKKAKKRKKDKDKEKLE